MNQKVSHHVGPQYRALQHQWTQAFGSKPPHLARSKFLKLALAWHDQMQASETWKGAAGRARLDRLLKPQRSSPTKKLSSGTRLVREWQGKIHQVTVLDKGYEYQGQTYASLSAIARHITGTPWSGPLFFGLKS